VVVHFWEPLLAHVLERRRRRDAEAHQEHVRLRVRQRAEPVVVFLAGRIEEAEGVGFVTDPASSEGWRFSLGCGTRDILVAPWVLWTEMLTCGEQREVCMWSRREVRCRPRGKREEMVEHT
jgi:hypothetical protein